MKNLQVRDIDDMLYFRILEWKARLRCGTWENLLSKIFSRADILEQLSKEEQADIDKAGLMWARSIDAKLDARDKEIIKKGEDILV